MTLISEMADLRSNISIRKYIAIVVSRKQPDNADNSRYRVTIKYFLMGILVDIHVVALEVRRV